MAKLPFLLVLLLVVTAPAQTRVPTDGHNLSQQQKQKTAAPEKWVKYEFDSGAVSILSPLKMNAVEAVVPADLPLTKTVTATGADAGRVFTVTFSILKSDAEAWTAIQREQFYKGIWEGLEASLKDTLSKQKMTWDIHLDEMKSVTVSGRIARQIGYSFGPYKGTMRAVVVGNRSYVAALLSLPEIHAALSERYLNSFTISTAAVPAKGART